MTMGILAKIKQFFGIGTVKVTLHVPHTFSADESKIDGTVELIAKSNQVIEHIKIEFNEVWSIGRGDEKSEEMFELGKQTLAGFTMKAGETKQIAFTLPFLYSKSRNERMAEKGGITGGLGKVAQFASGEKSKFRITATCDVKGATFDPNDVKELKKSK